MGKNLVIETEKGETNLILHEFLKLANFVFKLI